MAGETIGEAFMRPFEEGIRSGQSAERIAISQQRANDAATFQNARLQNMQLMSQMKLLMMQKQLAAMKQGQSIKIAQLQQSQNDYNEKVREFNINEQDKLNGIGNSSSKGSATMQAQNDIANIVKQYGALDEKTGKVDMSKIPDFYRQRVNQDLNYIQQHGSPSLAIKRILQFSNVKSTIDNVDISPLQYYSGALGKLAFKKDKAAAALGFPMKKFNAYETLVKTQIPLAAEQIGQAFGGSVQESASDIRQRAISDNDWSSNPELVKSQWDAIVNLANSEYKNALSQATNPSFEFGQSSDVGINAFDNSNSEESQPKDKAKKIIKLVMINGELQPQ
jgi:hypothetical protein